MVYAIPTPAMSDVYCFGHVSTGVILRLKGEYPKPDGYAEIGETLENHSGEATGSALVLAKFGVSVSLEGNWIGDTPACRKTLAFLISRGIDCSGLQVQPGYPGVTEVVISNGHTRTVFGRYCDLLFTTRQWEMPAPERIRAARLVCVDPAFGEATLSAARIGREACLPVVTCDTRHDSPLAAIADVIVISGELIGREYPQALRDGPEREALFQQYLKACRGLTVFTSGSGLVWYGRGSEGLKHTQVPFKVEVIDSAGAGDSFRGALIYGMLQGWDDARCVRFACATAALICTTSPGCVNPPSLESVQGLLDAHS